MTGNPTGGMHIAGEAAADVALAGRRDQPSPALWRDTLRNILHQRSAVIGLSVLILLALMAIFAQQLAPYDPVNGKFIEPGVLQRAGPCIHSLGCSPAKTEHLMGLDGNFRDVLSRVIFGARISLVVGFVTVGFAIVVGSLLGGVAGFVGGWLDTVIMRVMDLLLVFPALLLAIAIVTVLGPGIINAVFAIGVVAIPVYARIMRAAVLTVREQDFVTASRALGATPMHILFRRVLPNSLTPIIVAGTLGIGGAVLDIAALSFLGLGAPNSVPEWGNMIGSERNTVFAAPHLLIFPSIALTLTVLAFNLLGDGVRDALDPRLNR
jgi:ABC-type dipeptide/oligopeptide/nickel transport system permease subunit